LACRGACPAPRHACLPEGVEAAQDDTLAKCPGAQLELVDTERAKLAGVSTGRAPQLPAGAIVADATLDLLGVDQFELCPWALREGVILRRLDTLG